jgi:hypothetical protein
MSDVISALLEELNKRIRALEIENASLKVQVGTLTAYNEALIRDANETVKQVVEGWQSKSSPAASK